MITKECDKQNLKYRGQPITNLEALLKCWAEDETLMSDLWQCCYGIFARQLDWDNFLEEKAMKKLKFTYIDDDRFE